MKIFQNFFFLVDFLAYEPKILVNKQKQINTSFTAALSIIYILTMILLFIYFYLDFCNNKNIYVSYNEDNNENFNLNYTAFPIFFEIQNTSGGDIHFDDINRYFKINFRINKPLVNLSKSKKALKPIGIVDFHLKKCSEYLNLIPVQYSNLLNISIVNLEKSDGDNITLNSSYQKNSSVVDISGINTFSNTSLNSNENTLNSATFQDFMNLDFPLNFLNVINQVSNLENKYCVDPYELGSLYNDSETKKSYFSNISFNKYCKENALQITVDQCQNDAFTRECFSEAHIEAAASNAKFVISFIDYSVNNNNILSPATAFLKSEEFLISPFVQKIISYKIREAEYVTNSGYFSSYLENIQFHKFEDARISYELINSNNIHKSNINYLSLEFLPAEIKATYARSFEKIGNIISILVAISLIICYGLNLVCKFFIEIVYYNNLASLLGLNKAFKGEEIFEHANFKNNIFGSKYKIRADFKTKNFSTHANNNYTLSEKPNLNINNRNYNADMPLTPNDTTKPKSNTIKDHVSSNINNLNLNDPKKKGSENNVSWILNLKNSSNKKTLKESRYSQCSSLSNNLNSYENSDFSKRNINTIQINHLNAKVIHKNSNAIHNMTNNYHNHNYNHDSINKNSELYYADRNNISYNLPTVGIKLSTGNNKANSNCNINNKTLTQNNNINQNYNQIRSIINSDSQVMNDDSSMFPMLHKNSDNLLSENVIIPLTNNFAGGKIEVSSDISSIISNNNINYNYSASKLGIINNNSTKNTNTNHHKNLRSYKAACVYDTSSSNKFFYSNDNLQFGKFNNPLNVNIVRRFSHKNTNANNSNTKPYSNYQEEVIPINAAGISMNLSSMNNNSKIDNTSTMLIFNKQTSNNAIGNINNSNNNNISTNTSQTHKMESNSYIMVKEKEKELNAMRRVSSYDIDKTIVEEAKGSNSPASSINKFNDKLNPTNTNIPLPRNKINNNKLHVNSYINDFNKSFDVDQNSQNNSIKKNKIYKNIVINKNLIMQTRRKSHNIDPENSSFRKSLYALNMGKSSELISNDSPEAKALKLKKNEIINRSKFNKKFFELNRQVNDYRVFFVPEDETQNNYKDNNKNNKYDITNNSIQNNMSEGKSLNLLNLAHLKNNKAQSEKPSSFEDIRSNIYNAYATKNLIEKKKEACFESNQLNNYNYKNSLVNNSNSNNNIINNVKMGTNVLSKINSKLFNSNGNINLVNENSQSQKVINNIKASKTKDKENDKVDNITLKQLKKIFCNKIFNKNYSESNFYVKVESYLKKKTSIEEIIKKIYEVDKLKFVLFSEEILNIFSCIPNPNFVNVNTKSSVNNDDDNNNFNDNNVNNKYNMLLGASDLNNKQINSDYNNINNTGINNIYLRKHAIDANPNSNDIPNKLHNSLIMEMWNKYEFYIPTANKIKRSLFNCLEDGKDFREAKKILKLLKH